jgi:hypothetical protein
MTKDTTTGLKEALNEIKTKAVTDADVVCTVLDISRATHYAAVERGEIETLPVGKLRKPICAPLRKKLGI